MFKKPRLFPLSVLAASFALLDKGAHALTAFAAIALVWLLFRMFRKMRPADYLWSVAALSPIVVWGIFRYLRDGTAFFYRMLTIDLFNRVTTVVEDHTGGSWGPLFYVKTIVDDNKLLFAGVLLLLLAAVILLLWKKEKLLPAFRAAFASPKETWVLWIGLLIPLLLFSCSQSKIDRYIYPVYSVLAILAARGIVALYRVLRRKKGLAALTVAVCVAVLVGNEGFILQQYQNESYHPEYETALKTVHAQEETDGHAFYCTYKRVENDKLEVPRAFSGWTQSVLFSGELYADLVPTEGDETDFLAAEPGAYLMAPSDALREPLLRDNTERYLVCYTGDYLVILQRK